MNALSSNTRHRPKPSASPEWSIPLSSLSPAENGLEALGEVFRSGWWTYGPVARRLEAEFAEAAGVRHAIAVSSGTAALHLAFSALGVERGDEVLTPSLNFVASSNCLLHLGGVPAYVDVEAVDKPIATAKTYEGCITEGTRGLCVMHYAGYPCEMDEIMRLARRHRMWVVEDAAHAPGASWKSRPCGSWGDAGCFSFFGNKNITCGEGGMVTTQDDELADKIRTLRSHGMSSLTWDRYSGHRHSYEVTAAGFNFRIDDLRAAILRRQLQSLAEVNYLRGERVGWYRERLSGSGDWIVPFGSHPGDPSYHLFVLVLGESLSRDKVISFMAAHGIQTSVHYPPVHQFAFYRKIFPGSPDLVVTEALGKRLLTLPLFPDMTEEQVDRVCSCLKKSAGTCAP